MEVVNIPEKGRGMIATEDHKEGKVLLEEEPICSAQFSWGRKLGYSCCFHCMYPLEEPDQCIARLTQGQIISLPENSWTTNEYEKPSPVACPKTGVLYCSETCLKKADYDYMRLLLPNWEAVEEVEDLWRDMNFPRKSQAS
ncbi:Oidioi.mRNA.OKI2018_I69.XSR.g16964.t1.cds [Oikopleura dioica]|uniref:Oidioi.mRNA.OKI2018_I69.XSR.g16964.t1.cds n=1 Tax=Oikopleura dioica TaxID=34765 RepID=A0ABN7SHT1_OIKDI|nr:Oidioi.mRNA.OKI2018_I69.XSR.g16964.t1.cds [Oikopleura dioica]